jgi:hypothetical protein
VCLLSAAMTRAANFEPLFQAIQASGKCFVMLPGGKDFEPVAEGKAYPYGSRIKTDRKATLVIQFSENNTCRIAGGSILAVAEESKGSKLKIIKLDSGKVELKITEEVLQNQGLNVETCCGVGGAIGGDFSVELRSEQDLATTVYAVKKGKIKVYGPHYDVPTLDDDDVLFVSCAMDRSFTRVRNAQGTYTITYRDAEGKAKEFEMKKDEVVKIWRKPTPKSDKVTIMILYSTPTGDVKDAQTITETAPQQPPTATSSTVQPVTSASVPEAVPSTGPTWIPKVDTDVAVSSASTSTSVPPDQRGNRPPTPTGVGRRW